MTWFPSDKPAVTLADSKFGEMSEPSMRSEPSRAKDHQHGRYERDEAYSIPSSDRHGLWSWPIRRVPSLGLASIIPARFSSSASSSPTSRGVRDVLGEAAVG